MVGIFVHCYIWVYWRCINTSVRLYSVGINMNKWIDVKDKLPADGQTCIIRINSEEPEINYGIYNAEYKQFNNYDELMFDVIGDLPYGVTHWMPAPEFKE